MLTVIDNSIDAVLSDVNGSIAELKATSNAIAITVTELQNKDPDHVKTTTGYTFDANGLRINKAGSSITNLIDNTGMKVQRSVSGSSQEDVLVADVAGVNALNLTSRQYLIIGNNSRFENYSTNRTACYYIGP